MFSPDGSNPMDAKWQRNAAAISRHYAMRHPSLWQLYTTLYYLGWIGFAVAIGLVIAWKTGYEIGPGWLPLMILCLGMGSRLIGRIGRNWLTRRP